MPGYEEPPDRALGRRRWARGSSSMNDGPFVGREAEFGTLRTFLANAARGRAARGKRRRDREETVRSAGKAGGDPARPGITGDRVVRGVARR
jgi:hypothetical protein